MSDTLLIYSKLCRAQVGDTDHAVNNLYLYITNTRQLYEGYYLPIIKFLTKTKKQNSYNKMKAIEMFDKMVNVGVKLYQREVDANNEDEELDSSTFTEEVQHLVSMELTDKFEGEYDLREYDFMEDGYDANKDMDWSTFKN